MHKTDAMLKIGMYHPDRPRAGAGEIRVALLHVGEEPQKKCRRLLAEIEAGLQAVRLVSKAPLVVIANAY